jgi:hypothetical protein
VDDARIGVSVAAGLVALGVKEKLEQIRKVVA